MTVTKRAVMEVCLGMCSCRYRTKKIPMANSQLKISKSKKKGKVTIKDFLYRSFYKPQNNH